MAAQDKYFGAQAHIQDPLRQSFAITGNDSAELQYLTRALFIGTGGDVRVTFECDDPNDIAKSSLRINLPDGSEYPWRIRKVWATDTTADNMHGGF